MKNVTEFLLREVPMPFWKKYDLIRSPNMYHPEGVAEISEYGPNLPFPWYKRGQFQKRAVFFVYNVGLYSLFSKGQEDRRATFVLHDASGQVYADWDAKRSPWFPMSRNFDEVHEAEGLTDDDWVFSVTIVYLINAQLPLIVEVERGRPGRKPEEEKGSFKDKIDSFIRRPGLAT